MKTSRLVLPAALLSLAFMLGCAEQGSEIAGPQLKPGGGKPPASTATVTLATAVQGGPQSGLEDEGRKDVVKFTLTTATQTNFVGSLAAYDAGNCVLDPPDAGEDVADMLSQALVGATGEETVVRVDTAAASDGVPSTENRIFVDDVDTEGVYSVWLYTSSLFPDLVPTVTDYSDDGTTITFTMEGGVVRVRSRASPNKAVKLHCPYHGDAIDVTVVR